MQVTVETETTFAVRLFDGSIKATSPTGATRSKGAKKERTSQERKGKEEVEHTKEISTAQSRHFSLTPMTCIHCHTTLTIGNDVESISAGSLATDVGVGEEIHGSHRLQNNSAFRSRKTLKQRNFVHHFSSDFFLITEQIRAALVHDLIEFGLRRKMRSSQYLRW
jgi:hypothetical protein